MESLRNPFAELEPDAVCPPHVRNELISEIDIIRNSLTVVEACTGDFLNAVSAFLEIVQKQLDAKSTPEP